MGFRVGAGGALWLQVAVSIAVFALCAACAGQSVNDETGPRSLVSAGNSARVERVMTKSRRGRKVTLAVIGGSITQGAMASRSENRYGDLVARWWREKFPLAKVESVNAGIGATGSNYGALRAGRDLLGCRPDLVIVEYAVNDVNVQESAETLEGLVRQILKQPQKPAVVLLFMMNDQGGNAQEWLSRVGRHYDLPMISYRDALWPEIQSGRMQKSAVFFDMVHPNDAGHAAAAGFVTRYLDQVREHLSPEAPLARVSGVPKPLFTNLFEHVKLTEAPDLVPLRADGWTLDKEAHCWKADRQGSVLELEAEGRLLYAFTWRIKGPMGQARYQVDDQPPVIVDGWFDQTWGGYQPADVIARNLRPGKHHIRVEIVGKNAASSGFECRLLGIGAAGIGK